MSPTQLALYCRDNVLDSANSIVYALRIKFYLPEKYPHRRDNISVVDNMLLTQSLSVVSIGKRHC